ncbi:MAG: hypothetical protein U5L04_04030 [Trueperaceae bacterium]|nr:hypothetical protein [Trueperaceae bacterium]
MANATTNQDVFSPTVLADAVSAGFPGVRALYGTGAVITNWTMPHRTSGLRVHVPYLGNIGEMEILPPNEQHPTDPTAVAGLTMTGLDITAEQALVQHGGKMFARTVWSEMAAVYTDVYEEGSRQVIESIERGVDTAMINAALSTTLEHDIYDAGTPVAAGWKQLTKARMKFGDEQQGVIGAIVHSATFESLLEEADGFGRPFIRDIGEDGTAVSTNGLKIMTSDRLPVEDDGVSPPKYTSLILKRNSLVFWANARPRVDQDRDISTDVDAIAAHIYFVSHCYSRMPGSTKPGVVRIVHNGPS